MFVGLRLSVMVGVVVFDTDNDVVEVTVLVVESVTDDVGV